ncbi:MAG: hypothetical protein ACOX8W_02660 [bacterium]|jgi:hypothetical protein
MRDIICCLQSAYARVNPTITLVWAGICWVLFPDAAYVPAAVAVGIAVILDLLSKIYALAVTHGGYLQATKSRAICSDVLWNKTKTKLFAYFGTMILAGLALRVAPFALVGKVVSTVVYSIMFIREWQSVTENFIAAGADALHPLLELLRRKEKELLDKETPVAGREAAKEEAKKE